MSSFTADKIAHRFANPFARWAKQPQTKTTATGVPADFYDDKGAVIGAKDVNAGAVVNPDKAAASGKSAARRWIATSLGVTAAGIVLGFAGYGMFAAAPHIHVGVATFFASTAGHWAGIGLGVGIGVAALAVGAYVGVTKFNAWRHVRAERIAAEKTQAAADQALLAQAQAAQAAGYPPGAYPQEDGAGFWQQENPFAGDAWGQEQVAPETPVLRAAVPEASDPVSKAAKANWLGLARRTDMEMSAEDAAGWKTYYAGKIMEYTNSNAAKKQAVFNELHGREGAITVFPELRDRATFDTAAKSLHEYARLWNDRDARRQ